MTDITHLHVVGAGLLGTSIGLAAAHAGVYVTFEDLDNARVATASAAVAEVAKSARAQAGASHASGASLREPELVCIAVSPRATASVLVEALSRYLDATVMDVASVKLQPLLEIQVSKKPLDRVVLSHPIAGSATSGPVGATASLLRGRAWVLCALSETSTVSMERARELIAICGATAVDLTPERHDALLAVSSHLPQLVASALAASLSHADQEVGAVAGPAITGMTRTADSPPELWTQIAIANRSAISAALAQLDLQLEPIRRELANGDDAALTEAVTLLMRHGRAGRALLAAKHSGVEAGPATQPLASGEGWTWVEVMVGDRPGELARLLDVAAAAGVNIEDIRIDHAPHARAGTVSLAVPASAAERLRTAVLAQAQPASVPE